MCIFTLAAIAKIISEHRPINVDSQAGIEPGTLLFHDNHETHYTLYRGDSTRNALYVIPRRLHMKRTKRYTEATPHETHYMLVIPRRLHTKRIIRYTEATPHETQYMLCRGDSTRNALYVIPRRLHIFGACRFSQY